MNSKKWKMKVHLSSLKELSKKLYDTNEALISELVANSYDAYAKNVKITFSEDELMIQDDGHGMNETDLNNFLTVGLSTENPPTSKISPRIKLGSKGIGKLATIGLSQVVTISSKKDGKTNTFTLNADDIFSTTDNEIYYPETQDNHLNILDDTGTTIRMQTFIGNQKFSEKSIAKGLIDRFAQILVKQNEFKVIISNGEAEYELKIEDKRLENVQVLCSINKKIDSFGSQVKISESDIKKLSTIDKSEYTLTNEVLLDKTDFSEIVSKKIKIPIANSHNNFKEVNGINIVGWIGLIKTHKIKDEILIDHENKKIYSSLLHATNINVIAHGRVGQMDIRPDLTIPSKVDYSYLIGELQVDILEDKEYETAARTDRQGYNKNDERTKCVLEAASEVVKALYKKKEELVKENKKLFLQNEKNTTQKATTAISNKISHIFAQIPSNKTEAEEFDNQIKEVVASETGVKVNEPALKKRVFISIKNNSGRKSTGDSGNDIGDAISDTVQEISKISKERISIFYIKNVLENGSSSQLYYKIREEIQPVDYPAQTFGFVVLEKDYIHNWWTAIEFGMLFQHSHKMKSGKFSKISLISKHARAKATRIENVSSGPSKIGDEIDWHHFEPIVRPEPIKINSWVDEFKRMCREISINWSNEIEKKVREIFNKHFSSKS